MVKHKDGPPVVLHPRHAGAGSACWRGEGGEGQALHAGNKILTEVCQRELGHFVTLNLEMWHQLKQGCLPECDDTGKTRSAVSAMHSSWPDGKAPHQQTALFQGCSCMLCSLLQGIVLVSKRDMARLLLS